MHTTYILLQARFPVGDKPASGGCQLISTPPGAVGVPTSRIRAAHLHATGTSQGIGDQSLTMPGLAKRRRGRFRYVSETSCSRWRLGCCTWMAIPTGHSASYSLCLRSHARCPARAYRRLARVWIAHVWADAV